MAGRGDDDRHLSILVLPDSAGEVLYVDLNDDEDLTNDGPPILFREEDPEVVLWLTSPDDAMQRTSRLLQRIPRWVRENPEREAWFEGMHDERGNLKPMFAALAGTEGKRGTFYFGDRVTLRRGKAELDSTEIALGLFDYNANGRFDDEDDRLLLDLDGDGKLRFRDDSLVFMQDDVFEIAGKRYKLTYVDPYGRGFYMVEVEDASTRLHLEDIRARVARVEVPVRKRGRLDSTFWNLKLETISGDSLALSDFQGRPLLVNVWGEWCGPCVAELPMLAAMHAERSPAQLSVMGVLRTSDLQAARAVLAQHRATWPQVELTTALRERFDIRRYPTNLLILPDGETYLEAGMINRKFIQKHLEAWK